jgi:hypothetical protein
VPLSKQQIQDACRKPPVEFDVPELGGSVLLRYLPSSEKDAFEAWMADTQTKKGFLGVKDFRARLVAKCMVEADGRRMYEENQIGDLAALLGSVVETIYEQCERMNHMGSAKKQAAEQAAKNSESGQTVDSPTASPQSSDTPT